MYIVFIWRFFIRLSVFAQRNGIPEASRGDKSYQSPEYSASFHKEGSTRPIPNFGLVTLIISNISQKGLNIISTELREVFYYPLAT